MFRAIWNGIENETLKTRNKYFSLSWSIQCCFFFSPPGLWKNSVLEEEKLWSITVNMYFRVIGSSAENEMQQKCRKTYFILLWYIVAAWFLPEGVEGTRAENFSRLQLVLWTSWQSSLDIPYMYTGICRCLVILFEYAFLVCSRYELLPCFNARKPHVVTTKRYIS